jgi:hypothetical protein
MAQPVQHPFHPTEEQLAFNESLGTHPEGPIMLFLVATEMKNDMDTDRREATKKQKTLLQFPLPRPVKVDSFQVPLTETR